jgi:hypothetical protein
MPSSRPTALALFLLTGAVATGCDLYAAMSGPFVETVVDNRSEIGFVAEIDDYEATQRGTAFVAVPPMRRTVVDTVGEMNSSTTHVWLWSRDCAARQEVGGLYADGGVITIAADGGLSFASDYKGRDGPIELDTATTSCAEAAATLP